MQRTFQMKPIQLDSNFIEPVQAVFGNREIKIVIEDLEKTVPVNQNELYKKMLELRDLFKDVKVDPNLDLSALANEMFGE